MDTLQRALKALYYSLGGNADNVRDTDDVNAIIDAIGALNIGAQISGGGSKLPEVTSDDNGDVLTVVEGAWGKAAPSGGGALVVEATTQNGTDFTADITIGEMYEAALAGPVIIYANYTFNDGVSDVEGGTVLPLVDAHYQVTGINVVYSFFIGYNGLEVTGEATDTVQFQMI